MTPVFSLLDEPWIACAMPDGSIRELSLRSVFDGSAEPVEVLGDSPTQDYAVLRVILAIFWRAHRMEARVQPGRTFSFSTWFDLAFHDARDGGADEAALAYLDRFADRFDLLHPETPFMQVAGLHTANSTHGPISRIVPDSEGDLFAMRAGTGREELTLPEAARWVIHTQAYDYSGIKSGAVGDPRVKGGKGYPIGTGWSGMTGGTIILGATLRETLVLNTVGACLRPENGDEPVWEREPDGPAERAVAVPSGPCDLATWQARRIRLVIDSGSAVGVLVSNGDRIPDAGRDILADPMTPHRFSANKTKKDSPAVYYARPYDTERMMWRSLEPLVALAGEQEKGDHPPRRPATLDSLAGMESQLIASTQKLVNLRLISTSYGPQASSHATSVDARIDLPRALLSRRNALLRQNVLDAARATQSAAIALGRFAGNLLVAAGGEYAFQVPPTNAALARLEPSFRRWIADVEREELATAVRSWQDTVLALIDDEALVLLRGAGPKALIGREEIVNEKPQIRSAGTAYRRLRRELRDALPLASAHENRMDATTAATPTTQETTDE